VGGDVRLVLLSLDVDIDDPVAGLRQVLADDVFAAQHLGDVHPIRSMATPVEVSGDPPWR